MVRSHAVSVLVGPQLRQLVDIRISPRCLYGPRGLFAVWGVCLCKQGNLWAGEADIAISRISNPHLVGALTLIGMVVVRSRGGQEGGCRAIVVVRSTICEMYPLQGCGGGCRVMVVDGLLATKGRQMTRKEYKVIAAAIRWEGFLKSGKVRVWALGDMYAIEADITATDQELADAVAAEEELDMFRQVAQWN